MRYVTDYFAIHKQIMLRDGKPIQTLFGSDPRWDENRQTVEDHMAELGWERSLGTCKNVHESPNDDTFWPSRHFKCSKCGKTHVSMEYVYFCPNCGAEVVDG